MFLWIYRAFALAALLFILDSYLWCSLKSDFKIIFLNLFLNFISGGINSTIESSGSLSSGKSQFCFWCEGERPCGSVLCNLTHWVQPLASGDNRKATASSFHLPNKFMALTHVLTTAFIQRQLDIWNKSFLCGISTLIRQDCYIPLEDSSYLLSSILPKVQASMFWTQQYCKPHLSFEASVISSS